MTKPDLMAELAACGDCGMPCAPNEYHPFAACLMFKACHNSAVVRANLQFVVDHGKEAHHAELEAVVRDAGKCWALHFLGPDDVVAAPSREAAEIVARNFNAYWDAHKDERGHDVRVVAEVIEWEHGCVEHAKSAAQHWPEYADLLDVTAMHNSAREG